MTLVYRSHGTPLGSARTVLPHGVVYSRGRWYFVGTCVLANKIKVYKADRIVRISTLGESTDDENPRNLDELLSEKDGPFTHADERVRVRYSQLISRWIGEHKEIECKSDGYSISELPLFDDGWAVRHGLSYGGEAEILSPLRLRRATQSVLHAILHGLS